MRPVVVGVKDERDQAALDLALDEAVRRRLPLEVVHSYEFPAYGDLAPVLLARSADVRPEAEARAHELVGAAVQRCSGGSTVDLRIRVPQGRPAACLLSAAQGAALVVVGRRGGGALLRGARGSVSAEVLHGCWAPLALVPPSAVLPRERCAASRVVVGVDGSQASQTALLWAVAQAALWGSVLVPLVVLSSDGLPPRGLAEVAAGATHGLAAEVWQRVRLAGGNEVEVHPEFRHGHAGHELGAAAGAADLLVIGARGYGPVHSLLSGSVTTHVAESSAAPVVAVRSGQARREARRAVRVARVSPVRPTGGPAAPR